MAKVFVSYRREDSAGITGRLCDRLKDRFGSEQVFVDVDDIPYGRDFVEYIRTTLQQCDMVLAVIGRKWRGKLEGGRRRLDQPDDPVRLELETAFSRAMAVLPILADGAKMPSAEDLPEGLRHLRRLNAAPLDVGRDFHQHTERICAAVEEIVAEVAKRPARGQDKPTALAISSQVAAQWFNAFTGGGTPEVEYECRYCGFKGWIEKPEWFRDGERPPSQCPKCGKT